MSQLSESPLDGANPPNESTQQPNPPDAPEAVFDDPKPDGELILFLDGLKDDPTKPKITRTAKERDEDLDVVTVLYNKRYTVQEIGKHLTALRDYQLSNKQVKHDIRVVESRLKAKHLKPLAVAKAQSIDLLEFVQKEAMDAWQRSQADAMAFKVEEDNGMQLDKKGNMIGPSKKKTSEKWGRDGDPRFLDLVIKCEIQKGKLQGLEAPVKTEIDAKLTNGIELAAWKERLLSTEKVKWQLHQSEQKQLAENNSK